MNPMAWGRGQKLKHTTDIWCWWDEVSWAGPDRTCWSCGRSDGARNVKPIYGSQVERWREEHRQPA